MAERKESHGHGTERRKIYHSIQNREITLHI